MSQQDTENPITGVISLLRRGFEAWMFPVFRKQYPLPDKWPASTTSIELLKRNGRSGARLVRGEEFAEVLTETPLWFKVQVYCLGVLTVIVAISGYPQFDAFSLIASPLVYLGLGIPIRIAMSLGHKSAMTEAWDLLQGNSQCR